jgi:glycosyl transferase family 87
MTERLSREGALALCAVLLALIAVTLPELGSDPWPFRPGPVDASGPLGPLVRAAGREWDVGIARAAAFGAALVVAGFAGVALAGKRRLPAWSGVAVVACAGALLLAPSTLLQIGLRDSTAPWFFTNDSTYQVELAGDLARHGHDPYGHDYSSSGMERFYTFDGGRSQRVLRREVALHHYAYPPGSVITAGAWGLLPSPFDDYRLFILLCTLATLAAVMLIRAPLAWRLAIAAVVVCNPIAIRSSWFGQNDAPSLLLLVLSFALLTRRRYGWAATSIAAAVLLKQFAIVAVPFLAIMLVKQGATRPELRRAAAVFVGVLAIGVLPFFLWDPSAFWQDTVKYGAGTYRIVGYGLSAILVRLGVIADREGTYPFALLALLVWLPPTIWLLRLQWRERELWLGAAGFSISILVLLFLGRTFNNYYLLWPMTGALIAATLAAGERALGTRD